MNKIRALVDTADERQKLYAIVIAINGLALAFGWLTANQAATILPAVTAVVALILATAKATSRLRQALYGLLAAFTTLALAFGWISADQATQLGTQIGAVITLVMAFVKASDA